MDFDQSITDEFVAESKEHVETIEVNLLELEKAGGKPIPKIIDKVFRSIHSVKGAAGFLGFVKINKLSHIMETILQMMRSGDMTPEPHIIDALLTGVDILRGMIDDVNSSNDVEIERILERLQKIIDGEASEQTTKEMDTSIVTEDDDSGQEAGVAQTEGFEISEFQFNNLPGSHEHLFVLEFDLSSLKNPGQETPVALVKDLLSTGIIVDGRVDSPASDLSSDLAAQPLVYKALYSTMMSKEMTTKAALLPGEKVTELDKAEIKKQLAGKAKADSEALIQKQEPKQNELDEEKDTEVTGEIIIAKESPAKETKKVEKESSETVRIGVEILDELMTLAGELVLVRNQQLLALDKADATSRGIAQRLDIVTSELQESIMRTRMQPMNNVFGKLPRIARDLSRKLNKVIEVESTGNEVELDKTILESLADPLTHIIRNSCDHGIEMPEERIAKGKTAGGTIKVNAFHEAGQINIQIIDDGKGFDLDAIKAKAIKNEMKTLEELEKMSEKEIYSLVMLPGFSTAQVVSDTSGRGVGMDVVKTAIEQLGGTIELSSKQDEGTSIHLRLPLTLAIIPCLIVVAGEYRYAIPQVNLEELVCLYDDDVHEKIESAGDQEVYRLRDHLLPMVRMNEVLSRPEAFNPKIRSEITTQYQDFRAESMTFAVLKVGSNRFGLIVDQVLGTEEIVVKPMHPTVKNLAVYSGATVMGDGKVALILDIEGISRHAAVEFSVRDELSFEDMLDSRDEETQTVLLFKNGEKEQFAIGLPLIRRIERIAMKDVEKIGDKEFITIDGVSTMVLRLDEQLKVSDGIVKEEMFLLLPKHIKRPFGVLLSSIVDIAEAPLDLNVDSYMEDGLLGTLIVKDIMTLFLDIYRLIEIAEPEWFKDRKEDVPVAQEQKTVLAVEDTVFFRQLVKKYLESDGYKVLTAEHGKEALQILEEKHVDMIVSDIEMPVMNGWEFIEQLRADPKLAKIPAIALTALDSEEDKKHATRVGFDGYETKIDREMLLSKVAKLIEARIHVSQ